MGLKPTDNPFFIPRPETIAASTFFKTTFEKWLVVPEDEFSHYRGCTFMGRAYAGLNLRHNTSQGEIDAP